jgi:type VI protein secretion system component Hcp
MAQANSFSMGFVDSTVTVQSTGASGAVSRGVVPGTRTAQDAVLTMPMGNAAVMLSRAVMGGNPLPRATVQFMPANGKNPIFQAQFFDVLVTSVVIGKSGNDSGPGFVEVKLRASRYEMFNNNQDPRGALSPGAKAGIDVRAGKVY